MSRYLNLLLSLFMLLSISCDFSYPQKLEITKLKNELAQKDVELRKIKKELYQKDKLLDMLQKDIEKAEDKISTLRKSVEKEPAGKAEQAEVKKYKNELEEKDKFIQKLQAEIEEAKTIIKSVRDYMESTPRTPFPPRVRHLDGEVVALSQDSLVPLVMISLGTDDGVVAKCRFTVYRDNQYVGRIVVEEVYKDMSAAKIIQEMSGTPIQKGDMVTTRDMVTNKIGSEY